MRPSEERALPAGGAKVPNLLAHKDRSLVSGSKNPTGVSSLPICPIFGGLFFLTHNRLFLYIQLNHNQQPKANHLLQKKGDVTAYKTDMSKFRGKADHKLVAAAWLKIVVTLDVLAQGVDVIRNLNILCELHKLIGLINTPCKNQSANHQRKNHDERLTQQLTPFFHTGEIKELGL